MKIEITKTDGKVYPHYLTSQLEKAELSELLESDSANREQFVSAIAKYDSFPVRSLQKGPHEEPGHVEHIKTYDDLLAELGKSGGV